MVFFYQTFMLQLDKVLRKTYPTAPFQLPSFLIALPRAPRRVDDDYSIQCDEANLLPQPRAQNEAVVLPELSKDIRVHFTLARNCAAGICKEHEGERRACYKIRPATFPFRTFQQIVWFKLQNGKEKGRLM